MPRRGIRRIGGHTNKEEEAPFPYVSDNMWRVQDLCPLMTVCRRWRDLVLATPLLWSTFISDESHYSHPRALYKHYIHRCPRGPLYVTLREIRKGSEVTNTVEEIRERVRELHVEGPLYYSTDNYAFLTLPLFPNLERCAWSNHPMDTRRPNPFQFCDTPRLRTLELVHPPCIPASVSPALTDLSIIGGCPNGDFGQLLHLLSATPKLRSLTLGYLPTGSQTIRVDLPLLRHLEVRVEDTLEGPYSDYDSLLKPFSDALAFRNTLFSSLTVPLSCSVHFGHMLPEHLLPSARQFPHLFTATRLRINLRGPKCYQAVIIFSTESGSLDASFTVAQKAGSEDNLFLPLRDALSTPEFAAVRKLSLGPRFSSLCRYASILSAFPHLTLLRVSPDPNNTWSNGLHAILNALQLDADTERAAAGPLMCSELTHLWVDWTDVPRSLDARQHYLQFQFEQGFSSLEHSLRAFATAREARGHPLSRIFVTYRWAQNLWQDGTATDASPQKAYTLCEYDGRFTGVRSPIVTPDGEDVSLPRLEEIFAELWDEVKDAEAGAGVVS